MSSIHAWKEEEKGISRRARIADNTHIHGIREILTAPSYLWRVVFVITFFASMAYIVYELKAVIEGYFNAATSASISTIRLDRIPHILYCPQGWLNETKTREMGLDENDYLLLLSFFKRNPMLPELKAQYADRFTVEVLETAYENLYRILEQRDWNFDMLVDHIRYPTQHQIRVQIMGVQDTSIDILQVTNVLTTVGPCMKVHLRDAINFLEAAAAVIRLSITQRPMAYGLVADGQVVKDSLVVGEQADMIDPWRAIPLQTGADYAVSITTTAVNRLSTDKDKCGRKSSKDFGDCFSVCLNLVCKTAHKFGKPEGSGPDGTPPGMDGPPSQMDGPPSALDGPPSELSGPPSDQTPEAGNGSASCVYYLPGTKQSRDVLFCSVLDEENDCWTNMHIREAERCYMHFCERPCDYFTHEPVLIPFPKRSTTTDGPNEYVTYEISLNHPQSTQKIEEQYVYNWEIVVSSIGGFLGLWCGMSFLSILQIVYLAIAKE